MIEAQGIVFYGYAFAADSPGHARLKFTLDEDVDSLNNGRVAASTYGEPDNDRFFVYVKASRKASKLSNPQPLGRRMHVDPDWGDLLRRYCNQRTIPVDARKPQWWVVSYGEIT